MISRITNNHSETNMNLICSEPITSQHNIALKSVSSHLTSPRDKNAQGQEHGA